MLNLSSPALAAIFNEIENAPDNHILDLGEMRGGTFNFFSSLNCHFHSENLRAFVIENQGANPSLFNKNLDAFIRFNDREKKFDIVLMWDLLNYLSTQQVIYLFEKLKPFCNENALIHSLTYMTKFIPSQPARVSIVDNEQITAEIKRPLIPNPNKRTSLTLVKNISDFMMETNLFSTANVSTGVKEDLLRYVPHLHNQQRNLTKKEYSYQHQSFEINPNILIERKNLSEYRLPGLFNVLEHNRGTLNAAILDLGHDNQVNGRALLHFAKRIIPENLPAFIKYSPAKRTLRLNSKSMTFTPAISFDTILVWDLFHYLSAEEMQEVAERIHRCSHPGTLIHIICYSTPKIAAKPQGFYLQKDQQVLLKEDAKIDVPEKPLNSMSLLKVFNHTRIKSTHLLQEGMPKGLYELILEVNA